MPCGAEVPRRRRRRRRRVRDVDSSRREARSGENEERDVAKKSDLRAEYLHPGTETRNGCGFSLEQLLRPFVAGGFEKKEMPPPSSLGINRSSTRFEYSSRARIPSIVTLLVVAGAEGQ